MFTGYAQFLHPTMHQIGDIHSVHPFTLFHIFFSNSQLHLYYSGIYSNH